MDEIKANIFTKNILVHQSDIDELGHVNNVVYLGWAQDVAAAHWEALATPEIRQQNVWVALRHEIDYLGAAFEHETGCQYLGGRNYRSTINQAC
jgi:acyl-CoA thioester hydrolase